MMNTFMIPKTLSLLMIGAIMAGPSLGVAEKFDVRKLDLTKLPPAADKKDLTYAKDVRPILESSCLRCHGDEQQKGGIRLDSLEALLKGGKHGKAIVPGKSQESHLVIAVAQIEDETAMPPKRRPGGRGGPGGPGGGAPGTPGGGGRGGPSAKPLTAEQIGIIRAWIDQGGK
jgi:hypothetical protein